ncbi:MAG: MFS transporter [Candidatus Heimdallarchaeota archaeon]|nr:MFS transporter [Candidatus Heimdallarchaeota archaeon]
MNRQKLVRFPFWQELLILLSGMLTVMAGSAISPAIKSMAEFFVDVPNIDLLARLVLTVTSVAVAIGSPITGFLIDKFGRKKILIISTIVYILAGTSGFYLRNIYAIIVGRIFFGLAVSGMMTSTTALIADHYNGEKRNRVMGFQSTFKSFGGAIFVVIGGALASIDWNFSFLVYLFALIVLPGIIFFIVEIYQEEEEEEQDEVETENSKEQKSELINNGLGDVFPYKVGLISCLLIFIIMVIFYFIAPNFSFYLSNFAVENEVLIGLAIATSSITAGIISLFYKFLKKNLSFELIFIIALILLGSGYVGISLAPNFYLVVLGSAIMGLGWGMFMPNISTWLLEFTPIKLRGRILGIYGTMLYLGQFISPIIGQPIINAYNLSTLYLIGAIVLYLLLLVPIILLIEKKVNPSPKIVKELDQE